MPPVRARRSALPSRRCLALCGAVVLGLLGAGCSSPAPAADNPAGVVVETTAGNDGWHGSQLPASFSLPDLTFTDAAGQPVDLATSPSLRPVTLVFFGYTHCPDVCNTQLADVAAALRRMDPGTRAKVGLAFISVDPQRDTPAAVKAYLQRFDPSFMGLTAPLPTVEQAMAELGVAYTGRETADDQAAGAYEVGHGAQILAFGADRTARLLWQPGTPVGDLRADLVRLASNP